MNKIVFTRRKFINKTLPLIGKIVASYFVYLLFVPSCTIASNLQDDLDPPFIKCTPCAAGTTTITLSGSNKEGHFSGYNVWHGTSVAQIQIAHKNKDRSLVVDRVSFPLDVSNKGTTFPSITEANLSTINSVKNKTTSFSITLTGTASGNYVFVTAYSIVDNLDSPLSNPIAIP